MNYTILFLSFLRAPVTRTLLRWNDHKNNSILFFVINTLKMLKTDSPICLQNINMLSR